MSEIVDIDAAAPHAQAAEAAQLGPQELTPEAERLVQRQDGLCGRALAVLRGRFRLAGGHRAIRRENELVTGAVREQVGRLYGPAITQRSVWNLGVSSGGRPISIDRRAVAARFGQARSIHDEICGRSEVQAHLRGGERFRALAGSFGLSGETEIRNYERALIDALAGLPGRTSLYRVAALAETAALESITSSFRRADEFDLEYQELAAVLPKEPGIRARFGYFRAKGLPPAYAFALFKKIDPSGVPLDRSREQPVIELGDKVHLNVNREDLPEAWKALQPVLLSEDNPFLKWKLIMLDNVSRYRRDRLDELAGTERSGTAGQVVAKQRRILELRHKRVTEAAQVALYAYADAGDRDYAENGAKFRSFLVLADRALADRNVRSSSPPDSDVRIGGLEFASFRNQAIAGRGAGFGEAPLTEAMIGRLRETPFFKAINR